MPTVHGHHGHSPSVTPSPSGARGTQGGYSTGISARPSPPTAGEEVSLTFKVSSPEGEAVKKFDKMHTKSMHVILVSTDLKDFQHLHPTVKSGGALVTKTTLPRAVRYDAFAEFDPKGPEDAQLTRGTVAPKRARSPSANLARELRTMEESGYTVVAGRTRVTLRTGSGTWPRLQAGRAAHLVFELADARTGKPVADLKTWMQMPGHAIVISKDRKVFQHEHGHMMSGRVSGPAHGHGDPGDGMDHGAHADHHAGMTWPSGEFTRVGFNLKLDKPGLYKIFAQFKRGSAIVTAPFVVEVK